MIGYANLKNFMNMLESFQLNFGTDTSNHIYSRIVEDIFERTPDENLLMEITIEEIIE